MNESHIHPLYNLRGVRLYNLVDSLCIGIDFGAASGRMSTLDFEILESVLRRICHSKICNHDISETFFPPRKIHLNIPQQ